jgi:macrodomain Ter protein organizer (MatP/YcbG family)
LAEKNKSRKNIKAAPLLPVPVEEPISIKQTKTEQPEVRQEVQQQIQSYDKHIDLGFQVWETIQVHSRLRRNVITKQIKFQQMIQMSSMTFSSPKKEP